MEKSPKERIDEIGFGGMKLIQAPEEFCYGVDAVILADFAAKIAKRTDKIFDLGTGTGIIPLILSHKLKNSYITGVELQKDSAVRAAKNISLNGLSERIDILNLDVKDIGKEFTGKADAVVSNPPYMKKGGAITSKLSAKAIARHETTADLNDFFAAASRLLSKGGEFFMVHRPSRLADIFCYSRENGFEPKTLRLVCPYEGEAANIALIHFIKGGGSELKVMKDLFIHNKDGSYTLEIEEIYERI